MLRKIIMTKIYIKGNLFPGINVKWVKPDLNNIEVLKKHVFEIAKNANILPGYLTSSFYYMRTKADDGRTSWYAIVHHYQRMDYNHIKYMTQVESISHIFKLCGIKERDLNDITTLKSLVSEIAKNARVMPKYLNSSHYYMRTKADDGRTSWLGIVKHYQKMENNHAKIMTEAEAISHIFRLCGIKKRDLNDIETLKRLVPEIAKNANTLPEYLTCNPWHLPIKAEDGKTTWLSIVWHFKRKENNLEKEMTSAESISHIFKLCGIKKQDLNDIATLKELVSEIVKNGNVPPQYLTVDIRDRATRADDGRTSWGMIISHYMKRENNHKKDMTPAEARDHVLEKCYGIIRIHIDLSDVKTLKRLVLEIAKNLNIKPENLTANDRHRSVRANDGRTNWGMIVYYYQGRENNHEKEMTQGEARDYILEKCFGIKRIRIDLNDIITLRRLVSQIARNANVKPERLTGYGRHLLIKANDGRTSWAMILCHYQKRENNQEKDMSKSEAMDYMLEKCFGIKGKTRLDLDPVFQNISKFQKYLKRSATIGEIGLKTDVPPEVKESLFKALIELRKLPSELEAADFAEELLSIYPRKLEALLDPYFPTDESWPQIIQRDGIIKTLGISENELKALRRVLEEDKIQRNMAVHGPEKEIVRTRKSSVTRWIQPDKARWILPDKDNMFEPAEKLPACFERFETLKVCYKEIAAQIYSTGTLDDAGIEFLNFALKEIRELEAIYNSGMDRSFKGRDRTMFSAIKEIYFPKIKNEILKLRDFVNNRKIVA